MVAGHLTVTGHSASWTSSYDMEGDSCRGGSGWVWTPGAPEPGATVSHPAVESAEALALAPGDGLRSTVAEANRSDGATSSAQIR